MEGRESRKIQVGGGEVKGKGGENRDGRGRRRSRAVRARQGIRHHILGDRDKNNVAGELGDVSNMALLSGELRRRGTEEC